MLVSLGCRMGAAFFLICKSLKNIPCGSPTGNHKKGNSGKISSAYPVDILQSHHDMQVN